ncbi:glycosyltransferase [Enterobacter wuhouensis]|uniref:glycosyltransferase n=1 Tax=Enterobacter wuhouensis TaxID=2529381 RepID=UPI002FD6D019
MKFTTLLSLYYKEKPEYLYQCLLSINNNTLKPDQVVIVYDGPIGEELSTVVNEFTPLLNINIVELPENVGLGKALNYGMTFCQNNLVLRMDTDDVCLPDRFEQQVFLMKQYPNVALSGGAINEFNEDMTCSQGIRFSVCTHEQIKEYCKKRSPFNHMTVAFRKDVIQSVGGYQHHFLMEDYNLWLRVIAAGYETLNLNKVLVNVRAGQNMISRRRGFAYVKSEIRLAKLKYELKIDNIFNILICSAMRIVPRLLPTPLLGLVYKTLRK